MHRGAGGGASGGKPTPFSSLNTFQRGAAPPPGTRGIATSAHRRKHRPADGGSDGDVDFAGIDDDALWALQPPEPHERSPHASPSKRARPMVDPDSPFIARNIYTDAGAPQNDLPRKTGADAAGPASSVGAPAAPAGSFLSPLLRTPIQQLERLQVDPAPLSAADPRGSPDAADGPYSTCPGSPATPTSARTLVAQPPGTPPCTSPTASPTQHTTLSSPCRTFGLRVPKLATETEARLLASPSGWLRTFEVLRHVSPSGPVAPDLVDGDPALVAELCSCPPNHIVSILDSRRIDADCRASPLTPAPSDAFDPPPDHVITFSVLVSRKISDTANLLVSLLHPSAELPTRLEAEWGADAVLCLSLDEGSIGRAKLAMVKPSLRRITIAGREFGFLVAKKDKRQGERAYLVRLPEGTGPEDALARLVPPILANHHMSLPKYLARLTLGLSRTRRLSIPGLKIRVVDDAGDGPHVLTDGCGLASPDVLRLAHPDRAEHRARVPCAVQVRIGGAKGMLLEAAWLEERTVVLRKSMVKYLYPGGGPAGEGEHAVLEVVRFADEGSAYLNAEFVQVLAGLGVAKETFVELEHEAASETLSHLFPDPPEPLKTARFLFRSLTQVYDDSGDLFPGEILLRLILAGFDPNAEPWARAKLAAFARWEGERRRARARILVAKGASAIAVPDPLGVLAPGEMYFRGEGGEVLRGDVLCMRNPCHLPSDVQVYGAVHKPELAGYHNVCVFSTAGPGPGMAARLSGGDYDGDVVTMIWDDRLVGQVRRDLCGVPAELPGVAAAFERTPPPTVGEVLASEGMEGLAQRAWKAYVGGEEDMLGMYTRWHAMVAEHEGVASERAVELAQMCQRLVDAPKTGDRLLPEAEQRHRMFAEPLPKLFWWDLRQASKSKGKTPSRPAAAVPGPTSFLHDLAAGLVPMPPLFKERMDELLLRKAPLDEHLLAPLASLPSDPATQRDLELLKRAVTATYKRYNSFFAQRYNDAPQTPGKSEGRKIAEFKQRLEADFRGIGTEGMESLVWTSADTRLKVLGAIAYQLTRSAPPVPGKPEGSGQFCWEMALDALCQIKAYHEHNDGRTGPPRFPWAVPWTIARFLRLRWGK